MASPRRPRVSLLVLTIALLLPAAVVRAQDASAELLVGVQAGVTRQAAHDLLRAYGAEPVDELPRLRVHRARVAASELESVEQALLARPEVEFVERGRLYDPSFVPNDPLHPEQWYLERLRAFEAWDVLQGGPPIVLAVLDTGIDVDHPDFKGKLEPGWNIVDGNEDVSDVTGHGTQVAGIAGAATNDGFGIAAVGFDTRIMPVRVAQLNGQAAGFDVADGMVWAMDHGARVVNVSFGGLSGSPTVIRAAETFVAAGGVVVLAGGNCGCVEQREDVPEILAVSYTNFNDLLGFSASQGDHIDFAAPGVNVLTTTQGGGHAAATGSSFSAPMVAAAAALMLSLDPGLTSFDIEDALARSAVDLGDPGRDIMFGYGRIDLLGALLDVAPDVGAPFVTLDAPTDGEIVMGAVTAELSAMDPSGVMETQLWAGGVLLGSDRSAPYRIRWDTTSSPDGPLELIARAVDDVGNVGESKPITVQVANSLPDLEPPTVTLDLPIDGSVVSKHVKLLATATDDVGLDRVELYVDGVLIREKLCRAKNPCTGRGGWQARDAAPGPHEIQAVAVDKSGKIGKSAVATVTR